MRVPCSTGRLVKGAVAHGVSGVSSFPKYSVFASLCFFICLQAVYQLSGPDSPVDNQNDIRGRGKCPTTTPATVQTSQKIPLLSVNIVTVSYEYFFG